MTAGARVRVQIERPEEYAKGCASTLEAKLGTISRVKPIDGEDQALVVFDEPIPADAWWRGQSETTAFWFPARDLVIL